MDRLLENFKRCREKELPFCTVACPFQLDVISLMEKVKRKSYTGAYRLYRDSVAFPEIVSAICHQPCQAVCPGNDFEAPLQIRTLEATVTAKAKNKKSIDYNLPTKNKRIAVVGAGLSGLGCALRLATKKYEVEVFEASDKIGGSIFEVMPRDIIEQELELQFEHKEYKLHLNTEILSKEDLSDMGFDAVYVATGKGGRLFGLAESYGEKGEPNCGRIDGAGWFLGGQATGKNRIEALAEGLYVGIVIDNFLKTDHLFFPSNEKQTRALLDPDKKKFALAIKPSQERIYTDEEAVLEAERCLECQCDFCRTNDDLLDYHDKWPVRLRDEIQATILPGSSEVKATPAKRLMSASSLTGLCKEVCPEDIDLDGLLLEGRKSMHQQKKVPWAFHDYWLRDMEFANNRTSLWGYPKGSADKSKKNILKKKRAFFPGCQIGGSDPDLVENTYNFIEGKDHGLGIMSLCCGAPAEWSGDEEKHEIVLKQIRDIWEDMDRPELLMACTSCMRQFDRYLPEIPKVSLYEYMYEEIYKDIEASDNLFSVYKGLEVNIFDPCSSIHRDGMQAAVRSIAKAHGLEDQGGGEGNKLPKCCGFGGQPAIADPKYASFVTNKRLNTMDKTVVCSCINCRDSFIEEGRDAIHLLELLFQEKREIRKAPGPTQLRQNRENLKKLLSDKIGKEYEDMGEKGKFDLIISDDLFEKMRQDRILEDELAQVIEYCERSGRKLRNEETGVFTGYKEVGYMTYWVEYRKLENSNQESEGKNPGAKEKIEVLNAYSHRIKIELEEVWNGVRQETEM